MIRKSLKDIHLLVLLLSCSAISAYAQISPQKEITATIGKHISISGSKYNIPAGNYSGIAWIGEDKYVVISDKKIETDSQNTNSWQTFSIRTNDSGEPESVGFEGSTMMKTKEGIETMRPDPEGIVFVPKDTTLTEGTIFISAEGDQRVIEYALDGTMTGRELQIPEEMHTDKIFANYGFESLTYSPELHKFWLTTEQGLKADVDAVSSAANPVPTYLRMVCFGDDLLMEKQYAYKTDAPVCTSFSSRYAFGVPELLVLADGTLIVMEREFYVGEGLGILNSNVKIKLFCAYPDDACETQFSESLKDLPEERFMRKELLASYSTKLTKIANYEAMCLGPNTKEGNQNVLMINDSQNRYKGLLGEYLMNVVLLSR